jgi:RNA 3'-terminal phosphate cyclase (ATP)
VNQMIEIDGGQGEGGGQILRSALALSLITKKPFRISNIRGKRPKPGLMRQHLACIDAAKTISNSKASTTVQEPLQIGSGSLEFLPGDVVAGDYEFSIGSAGSCMLVLQTVIWPLLLIESKSQLRLRGGTHNTMAPSATCLQHTLPQVLAQCGGQVDIDVHRHGFYPRGGGEVVVSLQGVESFLPMSFLERGKAIETQFHCLHAAISPGVAKRELAKVAELSGVSSEACLKNVALRGNEGPGNALLAIARYGSVTEVFSEYGEQGVSAERVAEKLVAKLRKYQSSKAPIGPHLADQLLLPMALAGEGTFLCTEVTQHTKTNAEIIQRFLDCVIQIGKETSEGYRVTCTRK